MVGQRNVRTSKAGWIFCYKKKERKNLSVDQQIKAKVSPSFCLEAFQIWANNQTSEIETVNKYSIWRKKNPTLNHFSLIKIH